MFKTIIKGFLAGAIATILSGFAAGVIPNPGIPFWGAVITGILVAIVLLVLEKMLKL